jgi:nitroreductase
VAAAKDFQKTAKENRWNCFDAGAAWGYFSLEAQRRGLVAHAMGGFNADKAREAFSIADQLEIITIIALGYYGDPGNLSEYNQGREKPNTRKDFDELLL